MYVSRMLNRYVNITCNVHVICVNNVSVAIGTLYGITFKEYVPNSKEQGTVYAARLRIMQKIRNYHFLPAIIRMQFTYLESFIL